MRITKKQLLIQTPSFLQHLSVQPSAWRLNCTRLYFVLLLKTTLQRRLCYLVLVNQKSLNISYITKLSLLTGMLIAKNSEVSLAIREHKSSQEIWELKQQLYDLHLEIKDTRHKISH